jgi:hypothetical protein
MAPLLAAAAMPIPVPTSRGGTAVANMGQSAACTIPAPSHVATPEKQPRTPVHECPRKNNNNDNNDSNDNNDDDNNNNNNCTNNHNLPMPNPNTTSQPTNNCVDWYPRADKERTVCPSNNKREPRKIKRLVLPYTSTYMPANEKTKKCFVSAHPAPVVLMPSFHAKTLPTSLPNKGHSTTPMVVGMEFSRPANTDVN